MKNLRLSFDFILVALFLIASCSSNQLQKRNFIGGVSTIEQIRKEGVLKVGTTGDYRPFTYRSDAGVYTGLDIWLAQDLAKRLGVKVEFVQTTWKSLSNDLINGNFHIAMGGISINEERKKVGHFTSEYLTTGKSPIARCKDKLKYDSLEEINQPEVRVIVNPGGTNEKFTKANLPKAFIVIYPDNNTIFEQIAEGRADVMITDSSEIDLITRINNQLCATTPGKTFDRFGKGYFMLNDSEWNLYVDTWLNELIQNQTIKKKYQDALKEFSKS